MASNSWKNVRVSDISHFEVGDVICRKDAPWMVYRILSDNESHDAWNVEIVHKKRGLLSKGIVFKNDERWVKYDSLTR